MTVLTKQKFSKLLEKYFSKNNNNNKNPSLRTSPQENKLCCVHRTKNLKILLGKYNGELGLKGSLKSLLGNYNGVLGLKGGFTS